MWVAGWHKRFECSKSRDHDIYPAAFPITISSIPYAIIMNLANHSAANVPEGVDSNFDEAAYLFEDTDYEEFYLTTVDIPEQEDICQFIQYCVHWVKRSGLHISKP